MANSPKDSAASTNYPWIVKSEVDNDDRSRNPSWVDRFTECVEENIGEIFGESGDTQEENRKNMIEKEIRKEVDEFVERCAQKVGLYGEREETVRMKDVKKEEKGKREVGESSKIKVEKETKGNKVEGVAAKEESQDAPSVREFEARCYGRDDQNSTCGWLEE